MALWVFPVAQWIPPFFPLFVGKGSLKVNQPKKGALFFPWLLERAGWFWLWLFPQPSQVPVFLFLGGVPLNSLNQPRKDAATGHVSFRQLGGWVVLAFLVVLVEPSSGLELV